MSGDLKGLRETFAFLDAFPAKIQKGAIRASLTAAAKPVRDKARQNVAKKSGLTAKAIRTGSPRVNQDGTVSIRIRMAGKHSFLGKMLEYGVSPHFIDGGDSGMSPRLLTRAAQRGDVRGDVATGALKIGNNFISGGVMHPGFAPKPFLRPALDTRAGDAVNAMGERMRRYLKDKTGFTAPVTLTDVDDPEG